MDRLKDLIAQRDGLKEMVRALQVQIDAEAKKQFVDKKKLKERDAYVVKQCAIAQPDVKYDIFYFKGMDAATLAECVAKGWADPEGGVNSSPTLGEMLEFITAHPTFTAHGYVVSPTRTDTRISIEGVTGEDVDSDSLQAFIEMFRMADEFECGPKLCHCWYD